jgi:hypothetical protein
MNPLATSRAMGPTPRRGCDMTSEASRFSPPAWRVVAAFLIAPMVASLATACVEPEYLGLPSIWERMFQTALMFSVLAAYPSTVVIGAPVFSLLRTKVAASLANCALAGACVAAAPWLALDLSPTPNFSASAGFRATVVDGHFTVWGWIEHGKFVLEIGGFGAFGGVVFWLVAVAGAVRRTQIAGIEG